jgi:UDP-N-acetylmuramate dehydrogenase
MAASWWRLGFAACRARRRPFRPKWTASALRARPASLAFQNRGQHVQEPDGARAWELVDRAGCRGLTLGGAQVSEKHTNFLINTGEATSAEIEALGEEVRRRVLDQSGVSLEWEIKRVGEP